jgi:hypothetical protein
MEIHCIKCGCVDPGSVTLDCDDGKTFRCRGCDDEYTADDVRVFIGDWVRVLAWAETHPARAAEKKAADVPPQA